MVGLTTTPASSTSLLLNLEGVLTALLAWFAFRENFDRRIFLGMIAIVAGGLLYGVNFNIGHLSDAVAGPEAFATGARPLAGQPSKDGTELKRITHKRPSKHTALNGFLTRRGVLFAKATLSSFLSTEEKLSWLS